MRRGTLPEVLVGQMSVAVAAAVMARGGSAEDAQRVWDGLDGEQVPKSAGDAFALLDKAITAAFAERKSVCIVCAVWPGGNCPAHTEDA